MTDQPITPASLRGAVDLSALARPAATAATPSAASAGANDNLVIAVDDASFGDAMQTSARVPVIVALWSGARPDSKKHIDVLAQEVRSFAGRMQLATVDIDTSLQIRQALQVQQVPMVLAILAGQPVPLYVGDQPTDAIRDVLDKVLEAAAANDVTGRLDVTADDAGDDAELPAEPELPETHQRAFDAIEQGDYAAATAAYEQALADNPADDEARLGLGQVGLLERTSGADLNAARAAAADAPTDVEKQTLVADLDVLGGHIEDAFARLIDLVKATSGDERNAAREHLVKLFDVVGPTDDRVKKARTALMSALY
ncbi:co-chaperone YbbN [Flexivirga alba]|uniref:Co-chaperone YbbN n=1 Tax=Flexivirga alba TaxID=702742 RepID=A0ABW2AG79_9MICO